jgi:peroxiredoxin
MQNREGQTVPNVTFKTRVNGEFVDVTTDDLFKGRTVAVFSLPGAFTPTCSSTHLPRYNELAGVFMENGEYIGGSESLKAYIKVGSQAAA